MCKPLQGLHEYFTPTKPATCSVDGESNLETLEPLLDCDCCLMLEYLDLGTKIAKIITPPSLALDSILKPLLPAVIVNTSVTTKGSSSTTYFIHPATISPIIYISVHYILLHLVAHMDWNSTPTGWMCLKV